ncbi:hypothetical protein GCM10009681_18270 [Luedemannella helvata]|uniref:Uncharacterized protein n=1 Tax=Luedemannella helvata TaxID=349315 RepID=A0ABP4W525_9ACTN
MQALAQRRPDRRRGGQVEIPLGDHEHDAVDEVGMQRRSIHPSASSAPAQPPPGADALNASGAITSGFPAVAGHSGA